MGQIVYWHAPLWEVLLIAFLLVLLVTWLSLRAARHPTWSDVLSAISPALERAPLFFFAQAEGLQCLNVAAENHSAVVRSSDIFMDTLLESFVEGRIVQSVAGDSDRGVLTTMPLIGVDGDVFGVLAVLGAEPPKSVVEPPVSPSQVLSVSDWISLGATLWLHVRQPCVRVLCSGDDLGAQPIWQEHILSPQEDALLRFMIATPGEVCRSDVLFSCAWPEDVVEFPGLLPSQQDRLRRLIYQVRQHVEPDPRNPRYLCTAHGVGYVFYRETLSGAVA
ncbi:MAG: winged helix-turn-helix domain-containing protein [Anaerolineae bacterium]|nr:winged helix-turn-helix domain-containing protein [Anaerolineae bacterium]